MIHTFMKNTCKPILARLMQGDVLKFRYTYMYDRPHAKGSRLVGAAALKVCENLWSEDTKRRMGLFVGQQSKTGMALLYEMLMGQVELVLVDHMDDIMTEARAKGTIKVEDADGAAKESSGNAATKEDFSEHIAAATELNAVVPQFSVEDLCVLVAMHNGDVDAALGAVFVDRLQ